MPRDRLLTTREPWELLLESAEVFSDLSDLYPEEFYQDFVEHFDRAPHPLDLVKGVLNTAYAYVYGKWRKQADNGFFLKFTARHLIGAGLSARRLAYELRQVQKSDLATDWVALKLPAQFAESERPYGQWRPSRRKTAQRPQSPAAPHRGAGRRLGSCNCGNCASSRRQRGRGAGLRRRLALGGRDQSNPPAASFPRTSRWKRRRAASGPSGSATPRFRTSAGAIDTRSAGTTASRATRCTRLSRALIAALPRAWREPPSRISENTLRLIFVAIAMAVFPRLGNAFQTMAMDGCAAHMRQLLHR